MHAISRRLFISSALAIAVLSLTLVAAPQQRERSAIPEQYKWNLAHLFPSDEAWRAAKEKVAAQIPTLARYKGTLGSSAQQLADALDTASRTLLDAAAEVRLKPDATDTKEFP